MQNGLMVMSFEGLYEIMNKKLFATICLSLGGIAIIYMAGYTHGSTVMINYYGKMLSKEAIGYLAGVDAATEIFGGNDAESD